MRPPGLQVPAAPLLLLKSADAGDGAVAAAATGSAGHRPTAGGRHLHLEISPVVGDNGEDGLLENLVHAPHLLAAAFHVLGAHLLGHGEALLRRDGSEALGLQHVDACLLEPQVRLEANEDEGRVGTEVKDLGVPLRAAVSGVSNTRTAT